MGSPKAVKLGTIHLYTEKFTKKVKMMAGVEITGLYLLKKTTQYFISIESWSFCMSSFKEKIKSFKPNYDISVITDKKTVEFLAKNCWADYAQKEQKEETDFRQAIEFFGELFPNKKAQFFYELDGLLSLWCQGSLIHYDYKTNELRPQTPRESERVDYYTLKYIREHHNLTDVFKEIGKNIVVCPYIFENPTLFSYKYAGEFIFVVTEDTVYFQPARHF